MSERGRLPIATIILIVANLAAAFALVWQPDLIYDFGFNPVRPTLQSVFTGLFLHANLFHLLANMLFLAAVGAAVELATGALRFITVYFISGLAGVGLHYLLAARNLSEPHPLVGASGCIAGCAAYYGLRYRGLQVPIAPKAGVPVISIVIAWLVLQVIGGFRTIGEANASTAFWAHIGGFGAGLVMILVFRSPDLGHLQLHHEVLEKMNERGPAAAAAAALRHLEAHPKDLVALRQLMEAHHLMDDVDGEAGAIVRLIGLLPDEDLGYPITRLAEMSALKRFSPIQRMKLAERVGPHSAEAARSLLQSVIDEPPGEAQRPEAMLALAGAEREASPEASGELIRRLLAEYPLHPCAELAKARGWTAR